MQEHFELLYIVSMKHTGDDLQKVMDSVTELIKKHEGEISINDIFSKQKLAYPIKKVHQGTYVVVEFNMDKSEINKLEKLLRLDNNLLRFLILKKKIKTAEELEREKSIQEKLLKEKEKELSELEGETKSTPKEEPKEDKKEVTEEVKEDKKETEEVVEEKVVEKEIVEEPKEEKPVEKKEDKKEDEEVKEKTPKSKVSLDDLDKKLDEILTDEIL
jgi:small subunit ribosomal protein S6